jgi:hypothetical protein
LTSIDPDRQIYIPLIRIGFSTMGLHAARRCGGCLLAALLLLPLPGLAAAGLTSPVPAAVMADYHRKLEVYTAARRKYESEADAYWDSIAEKRRIRNAKRHAGKDIQLEDYVLTQPPVYSGPPRPVDP